MALRGAGFKTCAFPSRAWLIEVAGKQWLWDTGYASHFHDHTRSGLFSIYRKVTPVYFDSSESMAAQLAVQGLRPNDLQGLILSHFHGDHVAGLRDFPGVDVICSGDGWHFLRALRGISALRRAFVPGLIPEDFETRTRFVEAFEVVTLPPELAPFTSAYALPESRHEVLLVPLPGHAAGHLGAFVWTDAGWVLLAADAAWSPQSYLTLRGPSVLSYSIMDDRKAYFETLRQLHELHAGGHVKILLTHEGAL